MNSQSDSSRQDYYNDDSYYKLLGVEPDASTQDIKRAYRRLSLLYHPDKHNDDPEKSHRFRLLNEAYRILGNEQSRAKYNKEHCIAVQRQPFISSGNYYGHSNYHEEEIRGDNTQQYDIRHRGYHTSSNRVRVNDRIKRDMQMTDQVLNRVANRVSNRVSNRVANQEYNKSVVKAIEMVKQIDLKQSYYGATIPVSISRMIVDSDNDDSTINETERVYIDIPMGTDDGEIIVIKEKGNIIDGVSGDIRVKIKLNHESINENGNNMFYREALNLVYTKKITFKESVCGFSFCLKHINGREYTINNNTGIVINPNSTTIIPKLGFNKSQGTRHTITGDLVIKYIIEYPERIDGAIRDRLSEIL